MGDRTNPGPKPYLNVREEEELSTFLKTCSDIGYGKTRRDIMYIAQSVALDKGMLKLLRGGGGGPVSANLICPYDEGTLLPMYT